MEFSRNARHCLNRGTVYYDEIVAKAEENEKKKLAKGKSVKVYKRWQDAIRHEDDDDPEESRLTAHYEACFLAARLICSL